MTYGEVATDVRDALAGLVSHPTRPYVELGGHHLRTEGSMDEFLERVALIQRYRDIILKYVIDLARTASGDHYDGRIRRWLRSVPVLLPPLEQRATTRRTTPPELSTTQTNAILELWRTAALAAVVGSERELDHLHGRLNPAQRMILLKDAADALHALLHLDDRYARLRRWRRLANPSLSRAAWPERTSDDVPVTRFRESTRYVTAWIDAHLDPAGCDVDRLGHRPELRYDVAGGTLDAAITALQSLCALIAAQTPSAQALRPLIKSQWKLSVLAADLTRAAGHPESATALTHRGETYADLTLAMRNVTGLAGGGMYAVAYAGVATDQIVRTAAITARETVLLLDLLDDLDARVAKATRIGARDGTLLIASDEVRFVRRGPGGVHHHQTALVPLTPTTGPVIFDLLGRLEARDRCVTPPVDAIAQRSAFSVMLVKSAEVVYGFGVIPSWGVRR